MNRTQKHIDSARLSLVAGLAWVVLSLPQVSYGQDLPEAAELVKKYMASRGGADALKNVEHASMDGSMELPGISAKMTVKQSKGRFTTTMELGQIGTIRQGFDGKTAWEINPFNGPRVLEGPEKEQLLNRNGNVFEELNWAETSKSMKTVGKEKLGDREAYKVEFVSKSDQKVTRFFDTQTGMMTRTIMSVETPMGMMEVTVDYQDYKTVSGIKMPMTTVQKVAGQEVKITYSNVNLDAKLTDADFELPAEIRNLK